MPLFLSLSPQKKRVKEKGDSFLPPCEVCWYLRAVVPLHHIHVEHTCILLVSKGIAF